MLIALQTADQFVS